MANKLKYYMVQRNREIENMFEKWGYEQVTEVGKADFAQFTGGADVHPSFYGQPEHPKSFYDPKRDEHEQEIFWECLADNVVCAGICRGAQFLHVMNGGTLYHDVRGHAIRGTHAADFFFPTREEIQVTSTHHQMIRPDSSVPHSILGARFDPTEYRGKIVHDRERGFWELVYDVVDIESLIYPGTSSLCYQPHPEYVPAGHDCSLMYKFLLENTIQEKEKEAR